MKPLLTSAILIALLLLNYQGSKPVNSNTVILPDTALVGVVSLENPNPIEKIIAKYNWPLIDVVNSGWHPYMWLCNSDTTEFARLVFHEGNSKYQFSEIQVTSVKPKKYYPAHVAHFVTESGIQLGKQSAQVITAKGKAHYKNGTTLHYNFGMDAPFVKLYNQAAYHAHYQFDDNDRLVKFYFGFEYP